VLRFKITDAIEIIITQERVEFCLKPGSTWHVSGTCQARVQTSVYFIMWRALSALLAFVLYCKFYRNTTHYASFDPTKGITRILFCSLIIQPWWL